MAHWRRFSLGWLTTLTFGFGLLLVASEARAAKKQPAAAPAAEPAPAAALAPAPAAGAAADPAAAPEPLATIPDPTPPPPAMPPGPPESQIADGEAPKTPIPPAFPPAIPSIDYGARMRMMLKIFNPNTASANKLNDIGESVDVDFLLSGQIHRYFKWVASLTMSYAGAGGGADSARFADTSGATRSVSLVNAQPLDVYAHFALMPEFNVMLGRMLVIADRFAAAGPWGMDEFFFAGLFPLINAPALPKAGAVGRDIGMTIWGAPLQGRAKYYLGMFNLNDPATSPLFTGRIQASVFGAEPAFNQRTTYYGTKDLLSFGLGWQYQKDGSVGSAGTPPTVVTDGYKYLTLDATFEKNLTDVGTLSFIGAYSRYWGEYQTWKQSWLMSFGYMLPQVIGIGKPRMTFRYQGGTSPRDNSSSSYVLDFQASYPIHAWFARLALGYRHGDSWLNGPTQSSNVLYLAIQLWDP